MIIHLYIKFTWSKFEKKSKSVTELIRITHLLFLLDLLGGPIARAVRALPLWHHVGQLLLLLLLLRTALLLFDGAVLDGA